MKWSVKLPISLLAVSAALLFAGETRTWSQLDYADFEKGAAKSLSLRSDGLLSLAPSSRDPGARESNPSLRSERFPATPFSKSA